MPRRQHSELPEARCIKRIRADSHSIRPLLRERCERRVDFGCCAGFEDKQSPSESACALFYEQSRAELCARALGRRLLVLKAGTAPEIDAAFATLAEQGANAVAIGSDPFYAARLRQLAAGPWRRGMRFR